MMFDFIFGVLAIRTPCNFCGRISFTIIDTHIDSLRSMEADGIITRTIYPEVPPRAEYSLSELGESMCPIIKAMEQLGIPYKSTLNQQ